MLITKNLEGLTMIRASCAIEEGEVRPAIIMVDPGGFIANTYMPPQSVTINSIEGLMTLRDTVLETIDMYQRMVDDLKETKEQPSLPENIFNFG